MGVCGKQLGVSEGKVSLDPRVTLATDRWFLARGFDARVLTLTAEVRDLQLRFSALEGRFAAMESRFSAMESRLGAIVRRLDVQKERLSAGRERLDGALKRLLKERQQTVDGRGRRGADQ